MVACLVHDGSVARLPKSIQFSMLTLCPCLASERAHPEALLRQFEPLRSLALFSDKTSVAAPGADTTHQIAVQTKYGYSEKELVGSSLQTKVWSSCPTVKNQQ